jgi:flagellar biosynthetic protein FliQ
MDVATAVDLARDATFLTLLLSAPVMLAAIFVGLFVSILQALTQIQEQTISFVPKILAMLLVMLYILPWGIDRLAEYSTNLIRNIPSSF